MRIGIFCESLSAGKGGAERVAASLCNMLVEAGHTVFIVYRKRDAGPAYTLDSAVHQFTYLANGNWIKEVKQFFIESEVDLIHIFYFNRRLIKYLQCCPTGIKITVQECTTPTRIIENWKRNLNDMSFAKANWERELSLSIPHGIRFTRANFLPSVPMFMHNKVSVFYNSFDEHKCLGSPDKKHADGKWHIIFLNAHKENKDFVELLDAFSELNDFHEEWVIDVYGLASDTHSYFNFVRNHVSEKNLNNNVFFWGAAENIYEKFSKAHVHIMCSKEENFSLSTLEAMSCGVPTIGFINCVGVNELIIDKEDGLLVGKGCSHNILKEALRLLLYDHSLRAKLGEMACKKSLDYSPKKTNESWLKFFQDAMHLEKEVNFECNEVERHYSRMKRRLMFL